MCGQNGNHLVNLTIEEFARWQRWDEWPERADNPPLTVETSFWYRGKEYMVTSLYGRYVIVSQPDFEEVISNENFKDLLDMVFSDGKSFSELIGEFLFEI
ncbi:MAG: hypothetical protein J6Y08_01200 [Clostridiales bacterium]|nr:hypothetical protein [Clostridiales bacterium]